MSDLEMRISARGTGVTLAWANEEQYQLGKKFLMDRGALFFPPHDGLPEFVYLEERQDFTALLEFRKALREKGST